MADAADWAAQVDEIQALASIYEEDFKVIEVQGVDLPADGGPVACLAGAAEPSGAWEVRCELAVEVELPAEGGLRVRLDTQPEAAEAEAVEAATAGAAAGELGQADEAPPGGQQRRPPAAAAAAFAVAHLPPIMLRLRLHPGYPSTFPPYASLSALWLSPGRAAELEAQLEAVWEAAGPGGPVLYAWADWLQTAALTHLGAAEMLVIGGVDGGADGADGGDGEAAGEARLLSLLRYSAARELDLFQRATHSCGICMEEQPGARFVRLDCGHHFFCAGCVGAQARVHVADGSLGALKCAHPPCGAPLQAHTLRRVLPTEAYERWEALTLQRALDAMPDAAYCPRCRALALEDPADNCAQCPTCAFVFCSLCAEGRHPGVRCVSAETRLAMLRRKAEGGGAAAVAELRRREHEFLSLAEVERSSKPCPSCGAAIQRSEGCNKMACSRCSAFWCWTCGKQIAGYEHYKAGGGCILFDEAEVLRWEARWEDQVQRHAAAQFRNDFLGEFGGELAAGGGGGRGRDVPLPSVPCPQCGQRNFKFAGNNHMCCWSCARHFCALCRASLRDGAAGRRGGRHFGPGGCKQHT